MLVESFDLATFGRAPARFDDGELERVNAAIVHQLDFAEVAARLPEGMTRDGWEAIRPNLSHVAEAADWWQVVTGPIEVPKMSDADRTYMKEAVKAFEWLEWRIPDVSAELWKTLTITLKNATGRKGKELFLPLRLALTGRDHGPDMAALLPLIGEQEARKRLELAAAD